MAVGLRDVAARAGVSIKTVSNVVNGHAQVAPETRARVQTAIDDLHYRPNLSARSLRRGRSGVIALAVPQLDNPYFAELAGFVVRAAEEHGWTVLVDQTDGCCERERLVLAGIRSHLIDGLILSPEAIGPGEITSRTDETPLVLLGEKVGGGLADHVAIDNVAAAQVATEHLLDGGRRRVAAIGDQAGVPGTSGVARLRRQGYESALETRGVEVDRRLVAAVSSFQRIEGAAAMARLLEAEPGLDAVFCFNDTLALGALRTLAEWGLRVPADVAVVGVDDVEDGRFSVPSLTTIAPDKAQIASSAVAMLRDRLGNPLGNPLGDPLGDPLGNGGVRSPPRDVRADFALVSRESA